ncbi:MAG: polysaccharide biosynthesis protein [Oscillospiraceae bacterium]
MSEPKKQNYLHGATILAAGVIIMKILGAIYKIPVRNTIGDDGYALFLTAYNVYNVFLTLATAGLPVALSRMIAEANTQGRPMQARRTFSVAWLTFLVLGVVCSLLMYLFPTELAAALNNVEAAQSIWALSPGVLLVCLTSAYRGYCQGHENMIPTTIGQVLEVLVKVIVGLALAWYFVRLGKGTPVASAGAIFGVTAGGLAALIYMFLYKRRKYKDEPLASPDVPDSRAKILGRLMRVGIPITLGASVLSVINLVDTGLCMGRLQDAAGFSYGDSKVLYGVYGAAQTLYNLPAAFITPLTISIVPAIAACMVRKQRGEAAKIAENSLRISTVVALPMGVGLSVLAYPIMTILYPGSHSSGPELLSIMGIASFFVCIAIMQNAILQAHGNEIYPIFSMLAGGLVKIAINWFLVADPAINILGAPIGTVCCYMVMCVMNHLFLCKCLEKKPSIGRILLRPALSCAAMGLVAWGVNAGLCSLLGGADISRIRMEFSMLVSILAAVLVYVAAIVVTRAVTLEDMKLIPKGDRIAKLLKIR